MSYKYIGYVRAQMPDDLPFLPAYQNALRYFDLVKPFARGGNVGSKPLGRNRKYHRFLIEKGDAEEVRIKHYQTYILTYNADGSLFLDEGGHDSISTCQAFQEVLGAERFARKKGKIYYQDKNGHSFRVAGGLRVNADWSVSQDAKPEKKYALNRARFKDLKAKYKVFTDYTKQIVTLTQGGRENEITLASAVREDGNARTYGRYGDWALRIDAYGLRFYGNAQRDVRNKFFVFVERVMEIEDEAERAERMYPLAQYLSFCSATDYNVSRVTVDIARENADYVWRTNSKRVDKFFDDVLKFQFPLMCFDYVDAPLGKVTHDSNKKFIPKP